MQEALPKNEEEIEVNMGNRALRKEVVKLMKERHVQGKLYCGHRHSALRGLRARRLRNLKAYLSIRPGDLVHDCDGFNHVVSKVPFYHTTMWTTNSIILDICQIEFEDGRLSCGCSPPEKPLTREEIESYHKSWYNEEKLKQWWEDFTIHLKRYKALMSGQHICDENGILLPEFVDK